MTRGGWLIWVSVALVGLYCLSHRWSNGGMVAAMVVVVAVPAVVVWMLAGWLGRNGVQGHGVERRDR